MKRMFFWISCGYLILVLAGGCAPKYGCPANGKSVGAERVLSGEKVPKAKSFKN